MEYNEGDLVLCTVEDVNNTMTSVILEDGTKGTIISSEIASGRIKYMRMYVVPNKKIVCKVLGRSGNFLNLSLRRVNAKEKQDIMKEYKQKLSVESAFKQILKDNYENIKNNINADFGSLLNFIDKASLDEKIFVKYIPEDYVENIKKINDKRQKQVEVKYSISISCLESDGISRIKNVLENSNTNLKVTYISAGNFILRYVADNFKQAKQDILSIIENIKEKAKLNNCSFDFKEEKK